MAPLPQPALYLKSSASNRGMITSLCALIWLRTFWLYLHWWPTVDLHVRAIVFLAEICFLLESDVILNAIKLRWPISTNTIHSSWNTTVYPWNKTNNFPNKTRYYLNTTKVYRNTTRIIETAQYLQNTTQYLLNTTHNSPDYVMQDLLLYKANNKKQLTQPLTCYAPWLQTSAIFFKRLNCREELEGNSPNVRYYY